jgi:L-ribulose-5-phosphate 3-epimerase
MMPLHSFSRRTFLRQSTLATLGLSLAPLPANARSFSDQKESALEIHLFSKHLQFLDYADMAAAVSTLGFAGADLTVRPNGHVDPEKVGEQLPEAEQALRKAGLKTTMMTRAVTDAADSVQRKVLETAARLGFTQYRMGYFRYGDEKSIPEYLSAFQKKVKALAQLNRELGLQGAYQNHAGNYPGASIWEIWKMVKDAGEGIGCQYDIRHATVEGGLSWPTGLRLIRPWITNIVLKDFIWKQVDGQWKAVNTPLGEGMVDFKKYFRLLKDYGIRVPVSLHLEYDLGGAEHGLRKITVTPTTVFAAMKKDLETAQQLWREA